MLKILIFLENLKVWKLELEDKTQVGRSLWVGRIPNIETQGGRRGSFEGGAGAQLFVECARAGWGRTIPRLFYYSATVDRARRLWDALVPHSLPEHANAMQWQWNQLFIWNVGGLDREVKIVVVILFFAMADFFPTIFCSIYIQYVSEYSHINQM